MLPASQGNSRTVSLVAFSRLLSLLFFPGKNGEIGVFRFNPLLRGRLPGAQTLPTNISYQCSHGKATNPHGTVTFGDPE
jgi:hypothetical protein